MKELKRETCYIIMVVILTVLILKNFLSDGYPPSWSGDSYGHLFKIYKLMHGYPSWIEDWYDGYPFLRFYPPLSYFIGAFFGILIHSDIWGYKFAVFLAFIIGALSMKALLKELGFPNLSSYLGGIAYAFAPYHLRILSPEGNFPRFIAINFAPLLLLSLLLIAKRKEREYAILSGMFLALVGLAHHTLFVTFGIVAVLLLPYMYLIKIAENRRILKNLTIASVVAFLLSSFWIVPFILEKRYAHFLKENTIEYLFKFQSAKLKEILFRTSDWSFYQGYVLLAFLIIGGIIYGLNREKEKKTVGIGILIGGFLSILLSLGYYGPLPKLNQLPLIDMIPPYRWIDIFSFVASIGVAATFEKLSRMEYLTKSSLKYIVFFIIVLALIADAYPQTSTLKAEEFNRDYLAVLNVIRNDNSLGWRYYQWGLGITQGSRVAYTPALSNKPTIDGWYRQGDVLYPQHSMLNYYMRADRDMALKYLRMYGVKYVILDSAFKDTPKVEENLKAIGFEDIYSSGRFKLYSWSNFTLLAPKESVLVIGDWSIDLGIPVEKGEFIDDYVNELSDYSLIILNSYKYKDVGVWKSLEEYVLNGGVLFINTFRSPDLYATRFGVKSEVVKVHGKVNLTSEIYDTSKFSEFEYEGQPWTATVYKGDLESLIELNGSVVIGRKKLGRGEVYFIGLNLPYHAVYTNNPYEEEILMELISRYTSKPSLGYEVLSWEDGKIRIQYTLDRASKVIVSEAYYPHWKAYVDGKEVNVYKNEEFGLLEVSLPAGEHELFLRFEDPFVKLRYVSMFSMLVVLGYLFATMINIKIKK